MLRTFSIVSRGYIKIRQGMDGSHGDTSYMGHIVQGKKSPRKYGDISYRYASLRHLFSCQLFLVNEDCRGLRMFFTNHPVKERNDELVLRFFIFVEKFTQIGSASFNTSSHNIKINGDPNSQSCWDEIIQNHSHAIVPLK